MPIIDPDQGIDLVDLADLANNQAAFANFWTGTAGGLKSRVNLRYTDEANRTLLHPANTEGEESYLTASNRKERNDGTAWLSSVVSGHYNFSRAANQTLAASSIALQNVNNVGVALPAAGRFGWESTVFVSGVVASDIKFAYTWPAGATAIWGISGLDTTGAGLYQRLRDGQRHHRLARTGRCGRCGDVPDHRRDRDGRHGGHAPDAGGAERRRRDRPGAAAGAPARLARGLAIRITGYCSRHEGEVGSHGPYLA